MSTGTSTNCCDRCGRSLDGKGWVEVSQMKICGVCQYEIGHHSTNNLHFG